MIGYKATDLDGNCRGFHFEVGKTYIKDTPKEAFKMAYDKADDEGKKQLFKLPNFDADIFEEISGIDVREDYKRLMV